MLRDPRPPDRVQRVRHHARRAQRDGKTHTLFTVRLEPVVRTGGQVAWVGHKRERTLTAREIDTYRTSFEYSNSWRIGPDDTNWNGVLTNIDINAGLAKYAGPGGFNDPCLLLAEDINGKQRITELQSRFQFSMWAMMASPLLISGNLRNISVTK